MLAFTLFNEQEKGSGKKEKRREKLKIEGPQSFQPAAANITIGDVIVRHT